jgi:hypothetical protein
MTNLDTARDYVSRASDLVCLLNASYNAFTVMLEVIRQEQDRGGPLFPAFVMAGVPAANGRMALAGAPSLTIPTGELTRKRASDPSPTGEQAALAVAQLSEVLACRLDDAAVTAWSPGDRVACADAARHAWELHVRLGGARIP